LYAVWIKVDETLPWIELEGTYQTKREAKKETIHFLNSVKVKIVTMPEKAKQMKAMATIRRQ
jgi:hypothetical protein